MNKVLTSYCERGLIDNAQAAALELFVKLFVAYNSHTNLSAIRDEVSIWQKHIDDSLRCLEFEAIAGRVLDIGTGGGLPGIPLAIVRPEANITLLDSVGKKVKACAHFVEELELENTESLQARAEQLAQNPVYAKSYDVVMSRATAYLPTILSWSKPLLKKDGKIVLYKTPSAAELADGAEAAKRLRLKLVQQHSYELAGQERCLLVYKRA